jgi:hypothetical protein
MSTLAASTTLEVGAKKTGNRSRSKKPVVPVTPQGNARTYKAYGIYYLFTATIVQLWRLQTNIVFQQKEENILVQILKSTQRISHHQTIYRQITCARFLPFFPQMVLFMISTIFLLTHQLLPLMKRLNLLCSNENPKSSKICLSHINSTTS